MSNFIHNVDYKATGFSYHKYNSDIQLKATFNDFVLPAWTVENFNQNEAWKARYQLTYKETYDILTEEQKEKLREEVFESWAQTIWGIIRQRFGLVLDTLGWNYLTNNVKQNLYLAIAYQINNWRVNLPYEINNNINRVSGNLQTTINASGFETGFDALGEQTKTALTATGLDTYNYEDLLTKVYRQDTLAIEVEDTKDRISALEKRTDFEVPDNLITRVEAVNLFERIGNGYITEALADSRYVKKADFQGISSGGYFSNENKVSDTKIVKSIKNTRGEKELKIQTSYDSITYQFLNNNNVERTFNFDNTGLTIDNQTLPTTNSILSSIRNLYYDKTEVDNKETTLNEKIISEDNKVKALVRRETADLYYQKVDTYDKTEADNVFYSQDYIKANYYNKGEVDTKITAAQTSGQVDLSNYYNKNEVDNQFYTQEHINDNYYTKANSDLRLSTISANIVSKTSTSVQEMTANLTSPKFIIRTEPVKNSNNAARMEDIVSEVKRLFIEAVSEYDKTAKKEYTNVKLYSQFHTLKGDDEEIFITIRDKQIILDAYDISENDLLLYTHRYYIAQDDGNDTEYTERIYINKIFDKIDFIRETTSRNLGPAGVGTSGSPITEVDKVVIRKDSVRELVKALQNVV